MKAPAAYLLANRPFGTLYVGVTSNLVKRIWQHREGVGRGFTTRHRIVLLVWFEMHASMESAISREKAIKKWRRRWKLDLLEQTNPEWRDRWPEIVGSEPVAVPPARARTKDDRRFPLSRE